jgi:hypothetical protein
VPFLAFRPEKRFYRGGILALGVAVELDDEFDDELSTRYLIKRQRKLGESLRPIDRLRAVVLGSALGDRLNGLSHRQIGQLLFDFCWPELYVDGPELMICTHAIDRLRRSTFASARSYAHLHDVTSAKGLQVNLEQGWQFQHCFRTEQF